MKRKRCEERVYCKVHEDRIRLHGPVGGLAGGGDGRSNPGRVPGDAGGRSPGDDPGVSATEERNAGRAGPAGADSRRGIEWRSSAAKSSSTSKKAGFVSCAKARSIPFTPTT